MYLRYLEYNKKFNDLGKEKYILKWEIEFYKNYILGDKDKAFEIRNEFLPKKLYKYQGTEDFRITTLENNELYFSSKDKLNDPFDLSPIYYDKNEISKMKLCNVNEIDNILENAANNMGILSLSTTPLNMPLWAHYADNHKGICVEYDIESIKDLDTYFKYRILKVHYISERLDVTNILKKLFEYIKNNDEYNQIRMAKCFYMSMTLKHKDWSYEDEWRIFMPLEECNSSSQIGRYKNPLRISAIYIGKDCICSDIDKIKLISQKLKCKVYKMGYPCSSNNFSLVPKEI